MPFVGTDAVLLNHGEAAICEQIRHGEAVACDACVRCVFLKGLGT